MALDLSPVMNVLLACVPGASRGHKGGLDPLQLDLRVVVSCHMGAENQFQFLCANNQRS